MGLTASVPRAENATTRHTPYIFLGVPAAYSLARYEFPVKSHDIAVWFLSQRVMPPAVVLIPFYLLLVYLQLIDTWWRTATSCRWRRSTP